MAITVARKPSMMERQATAAVEESSVIKFLVDGQKFRLIDTAEIRRRAAVSSSGSTTEALSVNRAFRAIQRSDLAFSLRPWLVSQNRCSGLFEHLANPWACQVIETGYS